MLTIGGLYQQYQLRRTAPLDALLLSVCLYLRMQIKWRKFENDRRRQRTGDCALVYTLQEQDDFT